MECLNSKNKNIKGGGSPRDHNFSVNASLVGVGISLYN